MITQAVVLQASNLTFESDDLNKELTVKEWLKALLKHLLYEEEGFSGKRPFGNGGWKLQVFAAFISAGIVKGSLDSDGNVDDIDESYAEEVLQAIVDSF